MAKTGLQVVKDFAIEIEQDALKQFQAVKTRLDAAATEDERQSIREELDQAQSSLEIAKAMRDLIDKGQLTDKRLLVQLKSLRGA